MKQLLKFGFKYLKKKWYYLYLGIYIIFSIFVIIRPLLLGSVIDVITEKKQNELFVFVGVFFLISFLIKIFSIVLNKIYLYIDTEAAYISNINIIKKLYRVSYLNICKEDPVVLNQKINNDCNVIINFCISFFRDIISNICNLLFISAIIIYQMPVVAIVLFILIFLYIRIYHFSKERIYKVSFQMKESQTKFFAGICSTLTGIKSIRNNGFIDKVFEKQEDLFNDYYETLENRQDILNIYDLANSSISLIAQIFILLYGGVQVMRGNMSIGFLTAASTYFSTIIQSTNYFLSLGENYQETLASYNRLLPYLSMKEIPYGKLRLGSINSIKFDNVRFQYFENMQLFCINEEIKSGNIYWINGRNGTGKTTFINLMLGLFGEEYSGNVKINNLDLKQLNYRYVISNNISIVEQTPYLLLDTIKNNISCKTNKSINEQTLKELTKKFRIDKIMLREGNNDNNQNLSDGEKQKIVILRMLFSDANLWILDEPTSSLDEESKVVLYEELEKRKRDHIIIIISHEIPQIYDKMICI